MKAIILAGGAGTRLRPLTEQLPKPLVPFLGEPLLFRIIRQLKKAGFREILLTLGYKGDRIREAVLHEPSLSENAEIQFSEEETPLGTAGSVFRCAQFPDEETLIISGDCVTEADFGAFLEDFRRYPGVLASILATPVTDPQEFGTILTDSDGFARAFVEKPDWEQVRTDRASTGIYLIRSGLLSAVDCFEKSPCDFARDVFAEMLRRSLPIRIFESNAYWCDVGSPEAYLRAHRALDATGKYQDNVIWEDVSIAESAVVRDSIICDHAEIGENAVVQNSVLGSTVRAEQNACIVNARVDSGITIASGTAVSGVVRADREQWNQLRFPDGEIELVGSFTYAFVARLSASIAAFFERDSTVAVFYGEDAVSETVGACIKAGLLTCGCCVKEGRGIASGVARWILRQGVCDGGVFIEGTRIRLLNQHGNDLNRGERRRFRALFSREEAPAPASAFYRTELLQNPEDYYIAELLNRFPCPFRSLDYVSRTLQPENRMALLAETAIRCYPDAPVFVPERGGLYAEEIAKKAGRYLVRCGSKTGDMMDEMEKLMHIPGVYEMYLMLCDDLALNLGQAMLRMRERKEKLHNDAALFTCEREFPCEKQQKAAALRRISDQLRAENEPAEAGIVIRRPGGTVHVSADGERDALSLYVESFNEEFGGELLAEWSENLKKAIK